MFLFGERMPLNMRGLFLVRRDVILLFLPAAFCCWSWHLGLASWLGLDAKESLEMNMKDSPVRVRC